MSSTEPGDPPPRRTRRRLGLGARIALGSLCIFVLLLVGAGALIIVPNLRDEDPPVDTDLLVARASISPEEDAGPGIRRALRSLIGWELWVIKTDDGAPLPEALGDANFGSFAAGEPSGPGTPESWAASPLSGPVDRVLASHKEFFAAVERTVARPRCSMPEPISSLDGIEDWFGPTREGWQLLALRADAAFARGDKPATGAADLILLRYAHRFLDGAQAVLQVHLALAQLDAAITSIEHHLVHGGLAGQEEAIILELASIELGFANASLALRGEYRMFRNTIEDVPRLLEENKLPTEGLGTFLFQPNATLRAASDYYRAVIAEGESTGRVVRATSPTGGSGALSRLMQGNALGWTLLDITLVDADRLYVRCGELAAAGGALQALLALAICERERGRIPATLEDLVPHYLAAVPLDPWDGQPIRYDRDRRLVWSIGPDATDDGGTGNPRARDEFERQGSPDRLFRIAPREQP